jgi:hypothetical protein
VGVPETVAAFPEGVRVIPAGKAPALMVQVKGAVPTLAAQLAAYGTPTSAGPAAGLQRAEAGLMVPALKTCVAAAGILSVTRTV